MAADVREKSAYQQQALEGLRPTPIREAYDYCTVRLMPSV
jgi:hypothetical protein